MIMSSSGGGGVYSPEIWVMVCGQPLETFTLFQTKIWETHGIFPFPISDLTQNFIPYFRPYPYSISFA